MMQVTRKGKSISPGKSPAKDTRFRSMKGANSSPNKVVVPHDYFILRISPCPAEALKDLVGERRWMFKCRNMLLYITHRLHQLKKVGGCGWLRTHNTPPINTCIRPERVWGGALFLEIPEFADFSFRT